ncbi:MAG: hypothetical protein LUD01_10690 [Clostridiales bacterium]|nr:hypothetical protein [Clostridiales bacterium]
MNRKKLVTTNYTVRIGLQAHVRCALVSDLHDREPSMVLEVLRREKPDLILAAGDLMERHEEGESEWTAEQMDAWQGISRRHSVITKTIKFLDGSLLSGRDERKNGMKRMAAAF